MDRTASDAAAEQEYILGADESELARLLAQAEIHRREGEALLDGLEIPVGGRALDVGCGPLGVLHLLSERVGRTGEVIGLDSEPRMIALGKRTIAERGLENVRFVQADAYDTGLESESFDLAHERLVLINLTAPQDAVREIVRLVRPGGWAALQDVDWITWACEPVHPAWDELREALTASWQDAGLDPFIGRRLLALLRDAGLVDVGVDAHQYIWHHGHPYHTLLIKFVGIHRDRILAGGFLTDDQIDRLCAQLAEHLARPEPFIIYPPLFQAWGRKPTNPG